VNDYVDAGNANSLNITNAITIEAWIRNSGSNTNIFYVGKVGDATHRAYGLGTVSGKPLMWLSPDGTQTNRWFRTSIINLSTDLINWHHIVGTFSPGSGTHIYIDGILTDGVLTGNEGSSIGTTTSNLTIGSSTGAQYFSGSIDEVGIHNRALSIEEIRASYDAGTYRLYSNFTNLAGGTYSYRAIVQNLAGVVNQTETRTLNMIG